MAANPPTHPGKWHLSLRDLLLGSSMVLLTVTLIVVFSWFYNYASQQAMARVEHSLAQALELTVERVNPATAQALAEQGIPNAAGLAWQAAGDDQAARAAVIEQFGLPNQTGFSDDPRYHTMLDWMETVHRIEPAAWPYIWVNGEQPGQIIFVADLFARYNPYKSTGFLEQANIGTWQDKLELSTDQSGNFASHRDTWGNWYSGWMPIYNARGELVGAVGVDFEAVEVDRAQSIIRNSTLLAFVVAYVVAFSLNYWLSKKISRPIGILTNAARCIGEGDYSQDMKTLYQGRIEEIATLAHVFAIMEDKVQKREENLQQQVQQLRIEIDQVKRKQQVDEITDSEFFKDLQSKAHSMRRSRDERTKPSE